MDEPKLESSKELIQLLRSHSNSKSSMMREIFYQSLFAASEEITRVSTFLASLYGDMVMEEDPLDVLQMYQNDPTGQVQHGLHAVRSLDALNGVVLALERSGNGGILETLLDQLKLHQQTKTDGILLDYADADGTTSGAFLAPRALQESHLDQLTSFSLQPPAAFVEQDTPTHSNIEAKGESTTQYSQCDIIEAKMEKCSIFDQH